MIDRSPKKKRKKTKVRSSFLLLLRLLLPSKYIILNGVQVFLGVRKAFSSTPYQTSILRLVRFPSEHLSTAPYETLMGLHLSPIPILSFVNVVTECLNERGCRGVRKRRTEVPWMDFSASLTCYLLC